MNNNRGKLSVFGGFVALIASALTSSSAVAQEVEGYASTDTAILEEIVVTATSEVQCHCLTSLSPYRH